MNLQFKQTARNQYQIWTNCRFSPNGVYVLATAVFDASRGKNGEYRCFHSGHDGRLIGYATTLENCERLMQRSLEHGSYYDVQAPIFHFYK